MTALATAADPNTFMSLDQRGVGRPADGDNSGSAVCDLGAFELAAETPVFFDGFETGDTSSWSG